jgi:hypothetical protein
MSPSLSAHRFGQILAYLLAAIAAASVVYRLWVWEAGTAQYAAAGAPGFVYPALTALQAAAGVGLLFARSRVIAAAGVAVIPAALVARRAILDQATAQDLAVLMVAGLGLTVLVLGRGRE